MNPPSDDTEISVLFDVKQWKPACVLLQTMAPPTVKSLYAREVVTRFKEWVLGPTPDFKLVTATWKAWKAEADKSWQKPSTRVHGRQRKEVGDGGEPRREDG